MFLTRPGRPSGSLHPRETACRLSANSDRTGAGCECI